MKQYITSTFAVEKLKSKLSNGSTHKVILKRIGSLPQIAVHYCVCEKEANDVATSLTNALKAAAYQFDE